MIRQAVMSKFKSFKFGKSLAKGELVYVKTENDHYSCARHPDDTLWFGLTENDFVFLVHTETAKSFKQQHADLRLSIINKMKSILASKAEVMILSYYGDDKEADVTEATTAHLIYMLDLIETGKYSVEELDEDRHSFLDKTDDEN